MTSTCCHHWVIEAALGPASRGQCKFCRAEKIFVNYAPVNTMRDSVMLHRAKQESRAYAGGLKAYFGVKAIT
jgi:hypothetical protein